MKTEIRPVDRFIQRNTTERFGPVRVVTTRLVFEIAFGAFKNRNDTSPVSPFTFSSSPAGGRPKPWKKRTALKL
jgi:hypothetical protein